MATVPVPYVLYGKNLTGYGAVDRRVWAHFIELAEIHVAGVEIDISGDRQSVALRRRAEIGETVCAVDIAALPDGSLANMAVAVSAGVGSIRGCL